MLQAKWLHLKQQGNEQKLGQIIIDKISCCNIGIDSDLIINSSDDEEKFVFLFISKSNKASDRLADVW